MRISPQIVWTRHLSDEDLYHATRLQSSLTHSSETVLEATYLYAYATRHMIKATGHNAYEATRKHCEERMRAK